MALLLVVVLLFGVLAAFGDGLKRDTVSSSCTSHREGHALPHMRASRACPPSARLAHLSGKDVSVQTLPSSSTTGPTRLTPRDSPASCRVLTHVDLSQRRPREQLARADAEPHDARHDC
jgi:hypothetical protein